MYNKLHLGCGYRKIHGYINVDGCKDVHPDVVSDCRLLPQFEYQTIQTIYACHIFEHFKPSEANGILRRWFDLLVPGGVLRLSVPDLEAISKYYMLTKDLSSLQHLLYGDQKDDFNYHYVGYDETTLTKLLNAVGFRSVERYDWRDTEHFYVDDYSQSYLPKISYATRRSSGKIDGTLVSLNLQAIK
jgi:predicted SAM-dependent methyltransferase